MNHTSDYIKASIALYYRYVKQYSIIAFEADCTYLGLADVVVVGGYGLIEVEVKISIADLKKDYGKPKHQLFRDGTVKTWASWGTQQKNEIKPRFPIAFFHFAVPVELKEKTLEICNEFYPYAGVITVDTKWKQPYADGVRTPRAAKRLTHLTGALTRDQELHILKHQSGTLARLARDLAELRRKEEK